MTAVRVLLVFSSSELGGAERSLTRMALAVAEGVEYTLATLDGHGPWADWCRQLGATPLVLGAREAHDAHGRIGLQAVRRLIAVVRQQRYDALYVIGLRAALWLRSVKPWLRGTRIVSGIRWNPDSDSRLDRVFRLIESIVGRLVDLYICNSQAAAQTLTRRLHIPEHKVRVIYNGLDDLPPSPHPLAQRPLRVVTVANLNSRKGHLEYLAVVESVLRRLPQVRFVFVGRDDMSGRVDAEIARRGLAAAVTLTGYQANVGHWLAQARVMVLPSLWGEGCPTSILEGYAHGLPVIAYAIDGVPELVDDGRDGLLIAPGDAAGLADAIVRLLEDVPLAQAMAVAGRARVEQQFTLARCAALHASAFTELVIGRSAGRRR